MRRFAAAFLAMALLGISPERSGAAPVRLRVPRRCRAGPAFISARMAVMAGAIRPSISPALLPSMHSSELKSTQQSPPTQKDSSAGYRPATIISSMQCLWVLKPILIGRISQETKQTSTVPQSTLEHYSPRRASKSSICSERCAAVSVGRWIIGSSMRQAAWPMAMRAFRRSPALRLLAPSALLLASSIAPPVLHPECWQARFGARVPSGISPARGALKSNTFTTTSAPFRLPPPTLSTR
jgi:hypothetical protein